MFESFARTFWQSSKLALSLLLVSLALVGGLTPIEAKAVSGCQTTAGTLTICLEDGTITGKAPVSDAGVISQEIILTIEPSKNPVLSKSQIVAPTGWSIEYSIDSGATWSATEPANIAAWKQVNAIKATGDVNSQGATAEGKQIATGSATAIAPPSGSFVGGGTGDGWDVFFDDQNHVFNIFHHDGPTLAVDCHTRTGASCGTGWPFSVSPYHTNSQSTGWVDTIHDHLWFNTNSSTNSGFACIDISSFASGPTWCGGSSSSAFIAVDPSGSNSYDKTLGFARVGSKLFTGVAGTKNVICVDTSAAAGFGQACGSYSVPVSSNFGWGNTDLKTWGDQVFGANNTQLFCINPQTMGACAGWDAPKSVTSAYHLYILPNASGNEVAICSLPSDQCFNRDGSSAASPPAIINPVSGNLYGKNPETYRSRIYWGDGNYSSGSIYCFDLALNSGAGGPCPNWPAGSNPATGLIRDENYSVTVDPYNPTCIWTNDNADRIKAWDANLGTVGCTSLPAEVTFDGSVIVPRMSCSSTGAVESWSKFTLTGPDANKYTSATLTVTTASGELIPNWVDVPISGSREIDLAGLSVQDSGQVPKFIVRFLGRTGTTPADDAKATVTAIGDSPELCITPAVVYPCPSELGPLSSLPAVTSAISASGTATLSGGTAQTFSPDSESYTLVTPPLTDCASTISGTAVVYGTSSPIAGATVKLLDSSGNPVQVDGNDVTAITQSNGTYSFGTLAFGQYKVSFEDLDSDVTASNSTIVQAGSGTTTSNSQRVVSNVATLAVGTNGIVNASYAIVAISSPDSSAGSWDTNQTVSPLANDLPTTGKTLINSSLKLCGVGEQPTNCTKTSMDIQGEGTYTVNANGTLTFNPLPTFSGNASQITYQVSDTGGAVISSVITVSVAPAATPTATADVTFGAVGQSQAINPLANDSSATSGNSFDATSVKLCSNLEVSPNCTQSSLTIVGEGSFSINPSTGVITFIPEAGFSGAASSVHYSAQTVSGQKASSTYTPTVLGAPHALDDVATGPWNQALAMDVISNDGLGINSSTLKICTVNPVSCGTSSISAGPDGTYSISGGEITFTPTATFTGSPAPILYEVADFVGQVTRATYTPTILPPAPPIANPQTITLNATDNSKSFINLDRVSGLGHPAVGGPALVTSSTCLIQADQTCSQSSITTPDGTFSLDGAGVVTFTSNGNLPLANSRSIDYKVIDVFGNSASSSLTILLPVPPHAIDDHSYGYQSQLQTFYPLNNDTTENNFSKDLSTLKLCNITASPVEMAPNCTATSISVSGEGTYTVDQTTGEISFLPEPSFLGAATEIPYVFSDSAGSYANAVIAVVVAATPSPNNPSVPLLSPTADGDGCSEAINKCPSETLGLVADKARTEFGQVVVVDPLENDAGGPTTIIPETLQLCSDAVCSLTKLVTKEGIWTITPDNKVRFAPKAGFTGVAKALYSVMNDQGVTDISSITVTVANASQLANTGDQSQQILWLALISLWLGIGMVRFSKQVID